MIGIGKSSFLLHECIDLKIGDIAIESGFNGYNLLSTRCPQRGITELPRGYLRVTFELPTSAYRLAIDLV